MKINWRKVWKVLRVIGEIVLAVYGVVMTILYNEEEKAFWKEAKENVKRWGTLLLIEIELFNPILSDSQFRKNVGDKILRCRKDIEAIENDD